MKQKQKLVAALAITALAAIGSPGTAEASTTADTKVVNVVEVQYQDASGANTFYAAASSTVTINLVKSALNGSTAPVGGTVSALGCLAATDAVSGGTVSAIYALTATANGDDLYNLSLSANDPATTANANAITRSFSTLTYDGTVDQSGSEIAPINDRQFGSAIPVGISGNDTLLFPGGSLAGFAEDDVVMVEIGPVGSKVMRAFKVLFVNPGSAASHLNNGGVGYTTGRISDMTPEVQGSLQLEAYDNYSKTLNGSLVTFGGGNIVPAFGVAATAPTLGVPVGELVLVQMDIKASASSITADGYAGYTLTATNGTDSTELSCTVGPFKRTQLSIKKEASNISTAPGVFSATATGNPGQILEYRVTVTNTGGQAAQVTVADAVPSYTTLVTHAGSYGAGSGSGAITDVIAKVNDGTNSLDLTLDGADSETQPLAANGVETGFGKADDVTAGSPITFYLGDTSSNIAGGKLPYCSNGTSPTAAACNAPATWITSYTILYQVKID